MIDPIDLTKARILTETDPSFLIITTIRIIIIISHSSINHSSRKLRKSSSASFLKDVSNFRLSAAKKTQTRYLEIIRTIRTASKTLIIVILFGRLIISGTIRTSSGYSLVLTSTLLRKIKKISFRFLISKLSTRLTKISIIRIPTGQKINLNKSSIIKRIRILITQLRITSSRLIISRSLDIAIIKKYSSRIIYYIDIYARTYILK